jgi:tetratricopeptide (TPR) repeat protein/V8-like Glu-specific endopeptidase
MKHSSLIIIPMLGVATAIHWVAPVNAQQMTATQVAKIAKQSTVRINNTSSPGSGVIIGKNNNVYTILTTAHVLQNTNEQHQITMPDGDTKTANNVKIFPKQIDLAVVEFTSSKNYPIAKLAKDSSSLSEGSTVYVSGFPTTEAIDIAVFNFTEGKVTANSSRPLKNGYSLVYSNNTLPGHSGGPVWNDRGELVAIHGKGDVDSKLSASEINPNVRVKTGFNLGITTNTFTELAAAAGVGDFNQSATIASKPTPVDDLLLSGLAKIAQGKYDEAITEFDRAIQIDPRRAVAYLYRGTARNLSIDSKVIGIVAERFEPEEKVKQQFTAEYQLALADFQKAYQLNPRPTWALEGAARVQNDLGNYAQAIKTLDAAIAAKPTDNAYGLRAFARQKMGDLPGAVADYSAAIKLAPYVAFYYGMRGNVYTEQKNYLAAIADYDRAIRLEPKNPNYYLTRATAKSNLKLSAAAIQDYSQAIKLNRNPQLKPLLFAARGAEHFKQDNYSAAIADFSAVLQDNPRNSTVRYLRASSYASIRQYSRALADLEELGRTDPNFVDAYFLRGTIYLDTNQPQLSLTNLNKCFALVQADPSKKYLLPRLHGNRSGAYYLLKQPAKALTDANQAIALDPRSAKALYYRGLIKADRGNITGAIKDLEAAATLFKEGNNTERYQQTTAKIKQLRQRNRR